MRLAWILLAAPLAACAANADGGDCERAADHVAACFPDHAIATTCDPASAAVVADTPCEDLSAGAGKADGWCTIWTPWLCGDGGSSSSSSGRTIEVSVEECGGGPDDLCPYVQSAACGLVTLHDASDKQIAKGYTSGGGRITFEGLDADTSYTVKVKKRDGSLAVMRTSEYTSDTSPAKQKIATTSSGDDAPWARFELQPGSADAIDSCASLRGDLKVVDASNHAVDRHAVEWDWLVELETAGAVEITRPLFISPDKNVLDFRLVQKGAHTLRFVRMDIPSYEQKPNPDYARLRRLYGADAAPIEFHVNVTSSQLAGEIDISHRIVDPGL